MPAPESVWLWGGLAGYTASTVAAWRGEHRRSRRDESLVLGLLVLGVAALAVAVAQRWVRVGHGPFLTMFEILLSNLLTLGFIYTLAYWCFPQVRPGAAGALPVLALLGAWTVTVSPEPVPLPATYDNFWLWAHVITGKLFLGACLVAVGLAAVLVLRRGGGARAAAGIDAEAERMDAVAWRCMAAAFVFHSLMLVAGAAWAQDAWGRFWAWDPLETWAFITWLVLGAILHLRVTYRVTATVGQWLILAVFALGILTFLGVPFVSMAPHKGVM